MEEEEEEEDLEMEEEEEEEEDLAIIDSENMAGKVFEEVPVKDKQEESPSSRSADAEEISKKRNSDLPKGKQVGQELEGNTNESECLLGKQVTTGLYIGAGLVATLVLSVAWKFKAIRRKYNDVSTDENINDHNV